MTTRTNTEPHQQMGGTLHNESTTIEPPTKNGMQHSSQGVGRRGA